MDTWDFKNAHPCIHPSARKSPTRCNELPLLTKTGINKWKGKPCLADSPQLEIPGQLLESAYSIMRIIMIKKSKKQRFNAGLLLGVVNRARMPHDLTPFSAVALSSAWVRSVGNKKIIWRVFKRVKRRDEERRVFTEVFYFEIPRCKGDLSLSGSFFPCFRKWWK